MIKSLVARIRAKFRETYFYQKDHLIALGVFTVRLSMPDSPVSLTADNEITLLENHRSRANQRPGHYLVATLSAKNSFLTYYAVGD